MTALLVGGYGADMGGSARGVSLARVDGDGTLRIERLLAEAASPSWITVDGPLVYAALEGEGLVAAWRLDGGRLLPLGTAFGGGAGPCHLAVDGTRLAVANYASGSVGLLARGAGGALGEVPVRTLRGEGSGPLPAQQAPHAHHALVTADDLLLTADLGADRVHVHGRDAAGERVRVASLELPPGTGPRDLLDLGDGRLAVLGEWGRDVHLLARDGARLEILARAPLPGAQEGDQAAGLVRGTPGRILAGVRGSDRLAQLALDGDRLVDAGWIAAGGAWPRHLLSRSGLLHVSLQRSDAIASFRLSASGTPELLGVRPAPSPTVIAALGV